MNVSVFPGPDERAEVNPISPDIMARELGLNVGQMASVIGLTEEDCTDPAKRLSVTVQKRLSETARIISVLACRHNGNIRMGYEEFAMRPVSDFGQNTGGRIVAMGQGRKYLQHLLDQQEASNT